MSVDHDTGSIRVRYPEKTPDDVDAFTELATDERRSQLGGEGKSDDPDDRLKGHVPWRL
ncbi:MAG TPA: hypothetical protein VGM56_32530 [Byssovorax sp.]|jgi:hypothetical protein